MDHFGGLDVSVEETSIRIVDDTGRIVKEVKVASEPEALLKVMGNPTYRFKRIGLEAGPLSQGCSALSRKPTCPLRAPQIAGLALRRGSRLLPSYVEPRLGLEVVHRIVLEHGDAHFKRQRDGIGELFADTNIKGNEPPAGLSCNRVAEIHADVRTGEKSN